MKKLYMFLIIFLLLKGFSMYSESFPLKEKVYWISSDIGIRNNPMGGVEESFHKGLDITTPKSKVNIYAIADGIVITHYPAPDNLYTGHPIYGGFIIVDHGGYLSLYAHLSSTKVYESMRIKEGQCIGKMGNTGKSTGEHLHFEIVVNPYHFIENKIKHKKLKKDTFYYRLFVK